MKEPFVAAPARPKPSERQISCLKGKAEGKDISKIGLELGISASTAARELYAARCLLGAKNITHAIAIGVSEGWLSVPQQG